MGMRTPDFLNSCREDRGLYCRSGPQTATNYRGLGTAPTLRRIPENEAVVLNLDLDRVA